MDKKKKWFIEWLPYVVAVFVVVIVKLFIVTPIRVNGDSMKETLLDKDIMILNEISYKFSGIKRFDIVVLKRNNEYLIKRVIGLPGEKVMYKDNQLYINGKKMEENFFHEKTSDVKEIIVPDGEYYVLGDNRTDSTDSRVFGPVKIENIKGTTNFTIYPFSRFGRKE